MKLIWLVPLLLSYLLACQKAEIHATDASVADAVNFLNNTPGTAGHVADTFDLALSDSSVVTQEQLDLFLSKTNEASRDGNEYRIGDGGHDAYDNGNKLSIDGQNLSLYGSNQTFVGENGNDGRVNLFDGVGLAGTYVSGNTASNFKLTGNLGSDGYTEYNFTQLNSYGV